MDKRNNLDEPASLPDDMGFQNPEDDEPLVRPIFHAPVAQDFRDAVSLAPEDRQFELARGQANYPNAALLQEEMDTGRWWLYSRGGGLPSTAGMSDAMVLQLDANLEPYWGWVRAIA